MIWCNESEGESKIVAAEGEETHSASPLGRCKLVLVRGHDVAGDTHGNAVDELAGHELPVAISSDRGSD